jgi:hypothetical protein
METTGPLNQVFIGLGFFFVGSEISVVELLLPSFVLDLTIDKRGLDTDVQQNQIK